LRWNRLAIPLIFAALREGNAKTNVSSVGYVVPAWVDRPEKQPKVYVSNEGQLGAYPMIKLTAAVAGSLFIALGTPVALADDCFDQCFLNCKKFGQSDSYCTINCSDQTCMAAAE